MPSRAPPPPPLPTTSPPLPTVRPDRFRRVLTSTLRHTRASEKNELIDESSRMPKKPLTAWPTPPSPIDFDTPHARQASRARAVRRHVRRTKASSRATTNVWPTLSSVTYDPPPATQAEREYQQLRKRHDAAEARLHTLYAEIHLRMYVLGLLRPSDHSRLGLEKALDGWLEAVVDKKTDG